MINKLVEIAKRTQALKTSVDEEISKMETEEVRFCSVFARSTPEIQVYTGISDLAKEVGTDVLRADRDSSDYPHEFYFYHDGVRFYQVSETATPR